MKRGVMLDVMGTEPISLEVAVKAILRLVEKETPARSLPFYWEVGRIVAAADGGYGSNTRASIADKLTKVGVEGLQKENLAKTAKFCQTFDRRTAAGLENRGVSWRAAAMLCSAHIEGQRESLVNAILSGELHPSDLGRAIQKKAGTKAIANQRSIATAVERAKGEISTLAKIARGRGVSDESKEAAQESLLELKDFFEEILAGIVTPSRP